MAGIFLECPLLFLLHVMRFVCLTPIELKHKSIVCHKYCVKKLETTRNSLTQRKDLQGCFSVSYAQANYNGPDILCSAWCRGIILLQHYKKYIFSCIHINIFIVKPLHTPEKFNLIVLSANMITSLPIFIIVYLIKQLVGSTTAWKYENCIKLQEMNETVNKINSSYSVNKINSSYIK